MPRSCLIQLLLPILLPFSAMLAGAAPDADPEPEPIDFQRDIRPILSDQCFACHGPDAENRKAKLRLDVEAEAKKESLVAGDAQASELFHRITTSDADDLMPPPKSGKTMTAEQKELLRRWIEEGAEYKDHWAFAAPVRPDLPPVENAAWVRNPIDAFVLARLERAGLEPSPAADESTLRRRLSFDLTGLPPVAFGNDVAVEQLLASPAYGERWARQWLDAARYADSNGFEKDKPREVWFYRDWVIRAFNRDLPYDQFIIEQIAGDLLPDATQDQRVATGYLRNSMINEEGGIDPEQFRMEAMFDRMDAIGKGILGMTVQCAQCHSHKFDPLTQDEYYGMLAFLNNSHEGSIAVYTPQQQQARRLVLEEVAAREEKLKADHPDWPRQMAAWEKGILAEAQPQWQVLELDPFDNSAGGQKFLPQGDGSYLAQGYQPAKTAPLFRAKTQLQDISAVQLEVLTDDNLPRGGPGRSAIGTAALTEFRISARALDSEEKPQAVKVTAASADLAIPETELSDMFYDKTDKKRVIGPIDFAIDGDQLTAWGTDAGPGLRNVSRKAVFHLEKPIRHNGGSHLEIVLEQRHGGWNNNADMAHGIGRFRISILSKPEETPEADPVPADVRDLLEIPVEKRSAEQAARMFSYWRSTVAEFAAANEAIANAWKDHPEGHSQLVMGKLDTPRTTHTLHRGDFLSPSHPVEAGVPELLHELPDDSAPKDRLAFARWLVARGSPTAARAIVNRVWQSYFGLGLTRTSEDLGLQGEMPSHPELLDWLAVELMDKGWSLKHLHRLITDSATYRQSSRVSSKLLARDPENRLLARGPRFRLDAEAIRDSALAISGLLNTEVGGKSVYPPAPAVLFEPPASYGYKTWNEATGPERYRRALYTFQFRSSPYPGQQVFDAPTGEIACVRRSRSNTPLQALTTLNEPLFVECSQALAAKLLAECRGNDDRHKLGYLFERCVSRPPSDAETDVLLKLLQQQRQRIAGGEIDAATLAGIDPDKATKNRDDLAAWTVVCRAVLNLDETLTKE